MLLQKRFPRDIRHFMVMKRVISSPLSSALIDERRCRAILWARDLTQKAPQRPNLRRLWAIYLIQKRHDIEEMTKIPLLSRRTPRYHSNSTTTSSPLNLYALRALFTLLDREVGFVMAAKDCVSVSKPFGSAA